MRADAPMNGSLPSASLLASLTSANGWVTLWLARIACVALIVIAAVTFFDVIGRYFFQAPFPFTVELTQLAMAIVVYFGVGLVTHEDGHINADIVTLRLSPRRRALLAVLTNLLALGFLAAMAWCLWVQANFLLAKGDTTMVWTVPLWPFAFAVAFGSLFLLTGVVIQLLHAWARLRGAEPEPAPAEPTARRLTE
jgi:TRAP-type C4-dicarboxylate transport system permease small subunit